MELYCCQPQVKVKGPMGTVSHSVPTFYLHPNVQGITSTKHAEEIVKEICNPIDRHDITVIPNVAEVFIDDTP
jgi:hypothetical protein